LIAATHKDLEEMVKSKEFREDLYYRLNVVRIQTPPLRERMEDLPELIDFMLQRLNKNHSTGTTEISKEAMNLLTHYSWPGNVRELENVLHSASVISKGKRILTKDLPNTIVEKVEVFTENSVESAEPAESLEKSTSPHVHVAKENIHPSSHALPSFGKNTDSTDSLSAPSSISPNEAYDIAYASARTTTDINLLEIVEKEMIQRSLKESGGNQVKASAMLGITRATLRKRIDSHNIRY
jgi:two-component system nitrogen regulation response regulator GlnG